MIVTVTDSYGSEVHVIETDDGETYRLTYDGDSLPLVTYGPNYDVGYGTKHWFESREDAFLLEYLKLLGPHRATVKKAIKTLKKDENSRG